MIPIVLGSLAINILSCQTLEPEKTLRENTFMILYNKKFSQALCGEYKYLGEEKYSFIKWHTLDRCNGMFCVGKPQNLPESVLKPSPKPTINQEPNSGWNDK